MGPFAWIQSLARKAVNAGVMEGLRDVTPDDLEPPQDLAEFQARLSAAAKRMEIAAALPEPEVETPKKPRAR